MKIRNYLAVLIIACLVGGYLIEYVLSEQYNKVQDFVDSHNSTLLWQKDLNSIKADAVQYLISADLVLGSDETYLTSSTQSKGQLIAEGLQVLSANNLLLPEDRLLDTATMVEQINDYLRQSESLGSENRGVILNSLLMAYDPVAYQLSENLEQLMTQAETKILENDAVLQQLKLESSSLQLYTRALFSVALLLMWFWANRQMCAPILRLNAMANDSEADSSIERIKHGPVEIRELSKSLSTLTGSLAHQANHDALTNLYNRRAFERELVRSVKHATNCGDTPPVLCFIDLDRFKAVNDSCGHAAGDELLKNVSERIQNCLRESDFVARLGGDEFAILLYDYDINAAHGILQRIRTSITDLRYHWDNEIFRISASIGVTQIREEFKSTAAILHAADMACRQAKESGRDRVEVIDINDKLLADERSQTSRVNQLNSALENDRFVLFKQDIINFSANSKKKHYEILVRMLGDNDEIIPPGAFLPTAERYDLSPKLDQWIVNATIDWLLNNPEELEQLELCSINLSGPTISNQDQWQFIPEKIRSSGIPAHKLCFEITETAAVTDMSSANELISCLKEFGCQFALDDFGTGLCSFAYLKNLPVDFIKIDGAFVKDLHQDEVNLATVKAINTLAKAVNKKTIAEFVESAEIAEILKAIGVDCGQGYYFDKPKPLVTDFPLAAPVTLITSPSTGIQGDWQAQL